MRWTWLIGLAIVGCQGSVPSTDVLTRGVYAELVVEQSSAQSAKARATFTVQSPGGATLELAGADAVFCDDVRLTLAASPRPTYGSPIAPAASHLFRFVRADASESVPLGAPLPFTVTSAPLEGTYDSQYTITWTAPDLGKATIGITASTTSKGCDVSTVVTNAKDSGSFDFDGSSFATGSKMRPDCVYALEVDRDVVTPIAGDFAGGSAIARFVQTTSIHVHP